MSDNTPTNQPTPKTQEENPALALIARRIEHLEHTIECYLHRLPFVKLPSGQVVYASDTTLDGYLARLHELKHLHDALTHQHQSKSAIEYLKNYNVVNDR